MTLYNTSRYPTKEVIDLIQKYSVGLKDVDGVHINIKNSSKVFGGTAYSTIPRISNAPRGSRYLVSIRIGSPERFPWTRRKPYGGKKSPLYTLNDWREAVVQIAAHELQHTHQYRHNQPRSEVECETVAYRALLRYRESKNADRQKLIIDIQRRVGIV